MLQKRIPGLAFREPLQASQANRLVIERRIGPRHVGNVGLARLPKAHMKMMRNRHKPGNVAVLVSPSAPA
jgi:crotonyl-CoA carboxylase/reductase